MICPVETPIVSPWAIERENIRTPGVSTRARRFSSASTSVRPMFCSCRVRRTSDDERLLDLRRGEAQRLREAEARLEGHDEEVDQVGQAALDLIAAFLARDGRR